MKKRVALIGIVIIVALFLVLFVFFLKKSEEPLNYNYAFKVKEGVGGRAYYFTDIPNVEENRQFANTYVAAVPVKWNIGDTEQYPTFNQTIETIATKIKKTDSEGFYQMELPPGDYFIILDLETKMCNNQGGCRVHINSSSFSKRDIIIGGG